jgi:hypothetical protein
VDRLPLILGLSFCLFAACGVSAACAAQEPALPFSALRVQVASQGRTAVFRLYDTQAAREFYNQLPLTLDLTNFRDAQWMFYPPERLGVTPAEAYHDGKKGELSYYAPWGDVFMLYEDFYAGDEMHRLGVGERGVDAIDSMSGSAVIRKLEAFDQGKGTAMQMTVIADGRKIVFELNDSQAARDLLAQLPLETGVEDYGGKEKIYYPPKKLNTSNTPLVKAAKPGTLAYYAPWGDVVMFYGSFGPAPGLYELGHAVTGTEHVRSLSGRIRITTE